MKNVVFWDIKSQFIPHKKHIKSLKNAVFWDVTPCGPCNSRRFGGTLRLHHQGSVRRLLVTANVVRSSPILVTLMMRR
jgi:hypothetical protein